MFCLVPADPGATANEERLCGGSRGRCHLLLAGKCFEVSLFSINVICHIFLRVDHYF